MSYISKKILTKKAQSLLSKDVIEYLSTMKESYKANSLLNYAYYLKKNGNVVSVENLKAEKNIIDNVYIPDNDNKQFTLYEILIKNHYIYNVELNVLAEIAKITEFYHFTSKMIRYGIPNYIICYIIQETKKYNFGSIYDILIAPIINKKYHHRISEDHMQKYTKDVLTSPLVNYLVDNNLHIHESEYDKVNSEKSVLTLCYSDKRDFKSTKDGRLILFENEYIDLCKSYIDNLSNINFLKDVNTAICIETAAINFDLSNIDTNLIFDTIPSSEFYLSYNKESVSVRVKYSTQTRSSINTHTKHRTFRLMSVIDEWSFFAYERTKIFVKYKNKIRPASLLDLVKAASISSNFRKLVEIWINYNIKDYVFFKDFNRIFNEAINDENKVIPLTLNDLFIYNNWNEYFCKKYKKAPLLNINYGRLTPQASYMIINCEKYISTSDIHILVNTLRNNPDFADVYGNTKEKVKQVITEYYKNIINCDDADNRICIQDWIDMCFLFKKRISLRKKSLKKIIEEHDDISTKITIKALKKEKDYDIVKNNSKFCDLQKILPKDFEWIKTHKRLVLESQIQRHCVLTYEDRIKKDKNAIYSFVVPETNRRHTIEFIQTRDGKYKVVQIQKTRNRGYDAEIIKYFPTEIITL